MIKFTKIMKKNIKMNNESIECPLCMEPMDFDDVDFYPCPCRYQICRFCWDKILNEENGLCPACRKAYNSENPASYKPRTEEEIKNKIKHSKRGCPKKTKPTSEGKEYLAEYRVLQKNLIFVVGLPIRMAEEVDLLKGLEYFGRCGKVYKIVINQNQTFPGPQGTPCLSAYVTYHRNEDALKTLIDLKKLEIDGRAVKLSLGTTKYCSQFLRNRRCTKPDCMYLHEMGDFVASFTKEDMANGKHTEYENQLIQEFFDSQKTTTSGVHSPVPPDTDKSATRKSSLSSQPAACVSQHRGSVGTEPSEFVPPFCAPCETLEDRQSASDECSESSPPPCLQPDLPFSHHHSYSGVPSQSLLDSFYYLNSQASTSTAQSCYEPNLSQQSNNNGLSHYSQFQDFSRSLTSDKFDCPEQKCRDNADIDFDPIDVSRLGLAELIANENRQRLGDYPPHMYAPAQRSHLRMPQHDYVMQAGNDFYGPCQRGSGQSFVHEKQTANASCIGNNLGPSASVCVAQINSEYSLPPPGFEVAHNSGGTGEPHPNDIMSMMLNADMFSRYQQSGSDISGGLSQHGPHYSNQYSIPPGNNYHNEFNGFSNGYSDLNSHSHPWKNVPAMFCDGNQDLPQLGVRSATYSRSHSVNDNTGMRSADWNGFASYNNANDSHMTNFQDGSFMVPPRGQAVQCSATSSGHEPQIYPRQQASHSVNH